MLPTRDSLQGLPSLGLCTSTSGGTGLIPGQELRSCILRGTAKRTLTSCLKTHRLKVKGWKKILCKWKGKESWRNNTYIRQNRLQNKDCNKRQRRAVCNDKGVNLGTSLVVKCLRIRLPMQGTWVQALVQEDPTCHRATKPLCHNDWARALEPASHNYWAHMLQLLKPMCLEPMLHNKRSHHNEKPAHHNKE